MSFSTAECDLCHQTFFCSHSEFKDGDPPSRCSSCANPENCGMLTQNKRPCNSLFFSYSSARSSANVYDSSYSGPLSPVNVDLSPTHNMPSPVVLPTAPTSTILNLLQARSNTGSRAAIASNIADWQTILRDCVATDHPELSFMLIGDWPFFRKVGRSGRTASSTTGCSTGEAKAPGPSAVILKLYDRLKSSPECPSNLLVINWLHCGRRDRTERYYGVLPANIFFDLVSRAINPDVVVRKATTVNSYFGFSCQYPIRCITSVPEFCNTFCQLMPSNSKVRLIFDLDLYQATEITLIQESEHILTLLQLLRHTLIRLNYGPMVTDDTCAVIANFVLLRGHRYCPSKSMFKFSAHLHFCDLFCDNNHIVMKQLYSQLLSDYNGTFELFDKLMTSTHRVFRLAGCTTQRSAKIEDEEQLASRLVPVKVFYSPNSETPLVETFMDMQDLSAEEKSWLLVHDPALENKDSGWILSVKDVTPAWTLPTRPGTSTSSAGGTETASSSSASSANPIINSRSRATQNAPHGPFNDVEWTNIYEVFNLFLKERQANWPDFISADVELPSIESMTVLDGHPTTVYINCMGDRYCEIKGRLHAGDNGSQTSYAYDGLKMVCWQCCFSCRPSRNSGGGAVYSFCPGYNELRSLEPSLWDCVQLELTVAKMFYDDYKHLIRVVVKGKEKVLYIFDENTKLWQSDSQVFIWTNWSVWISRKFLLIQKHCGFDDDQMKYVKLWRKSCTTVTKVQTVITFCKNSANDSNFPNQLNAKQNLIPLKDGQVFDVLTGELRTRTMKDDFSQCMQFEMLDVNDPLVRQCHDILYEFSNDSPDWLNYLQMFAGYCLTGYTMDRGWYGWFGIGANGKGTFANALQKIMGEFYQNIGHSFLSKGGNAGTNAEAASPNMASLRHARAVVISEWPASVHTAGEKIKALSSGDPVRCRALYGSPEVWTPVFKIVVCCNFFPLQDSTDQAAWDRFRGQKWATRFVPNPTRANEVRADAFKANALQGELLNAFGTWCIIGALKCREATEGFRYQIPRPPIVQEFMEKTKHDADLISSFLSTNAVYDPDCEWDAMEMYMDFKTWVNRWQATMASLPLDVFIAQVTKRTEISDVRFVDRENWKVFVGVTKREFVRAAVEDEITINSP
jgi:hypothetical protein